MVTKGRTATVTAYHGNSSPSDYHVSTFKDIAWWNSCDMMTDYTERLSTGNIQRLVSRMTNASHVAETMRKSRGTTV